MPEPTPTETTTPDPRPIGLMEQPYRLQLRSESGTVLDLGSMTLELHVVMKPDGTLAFRDVWGPVADGLEAAARELRKLADRA